MICIFLIDMKIIDKMRRSWSNSLGQKVVNWSELTNLLDVNGLLFSLFNISLEISGSQVPVNFSFSSESVPSSASLFNAESSEFSVKSSDWNLSSFSVLSQLLFSCGFSSLWSFPFELDYRGNLKRSPSGMSSRESFVCLSVKYWVRSVIFLDGFSLSVLDFDGIRFVQSAIVFLFWASVEVGVFLGNFGWSWGWVNLGQRHLLNFWWSLDSCFMSLTSPARNQFWFLEGLRRRNIFLVEIILLFVEFEQVVFGFLVEGVPLLDDFWDDLWLSHSWELGLVFEILLPGKLSVDLSHDFFSAGLICALHRIFKIQL